MPRLTYAIAMPSVQDWANAVAVAEGSTAGLSVGSRLNNPGDVKYGPTAAAYGCTQGQGGFAQCPDAATGNELTVAVLYGYLTSHPGWTFEQAMDTYAGNPGQGYINTVASQLGVDPGATIGSIFGTQRVGSSNPAPFTPLIPLGASAAPAVNLGGSSGSPLLWIALGLGALLVAAAV